MSQKYTPTFLKEQTEPEPEAKTRVFGANQNTSTTSGNQFATFTNKQDRPINTSRPAMEAPKLVPATLASITSSGGVTTNGATNGVTNSSSGSGRSFASKFSQQVNGSQYSTKAIPPPPKPIDVSNEDAFPSLGSKPIKAIPSKPVPSKPVSTKQISGVAATNTTFANLAKGWAKQTEEEKEAEKIRKMREEEMERDKRLLLSMPIVSIRRRKAQHIMDNEDDNNYDESSLCDDDKEYEVPEEAESSEDDVEDEDENEFNKNVGWDGRRKDDLY